MYYEIYIDILFIENMVMDFLLLCLVSLLLIRKIYFRRCLLGALVGAVGICILAVFPLSQWQNRVAAHAVINTLMIKSGCKIKKTGDMLKGIFLLYMNSFLLGGILQVILKYFPQKNTGILLLAGLAAAAMMAAAVILERQEKRKAELYYSICLYANGKCIEGTAFLDTGNHLADGMGKKPVCICEKAFLQKLISPGVWTRLEAMETGNIVAEERTAEEQAAEERSAEKWAAEEQIAEKRPAKKQAAEKRAAEEMAETQFGRLMPHFLPFTSVGCRNGMMLAVTLDFLSLENQGVHKLIKRPVIAFSSETGNFRGDYQVILHPGLIDDQEEKV